MASLCLIFYPKFPEIGKNETISFGYDVNDHVFTQSKPVQLRMG